MANGVPFFPEQSMTRLEALHSYTTAAAFAAFEETEKGTLTPGKLADIIVLNNDLRTVGDDDILKTRVSYTIVGGKIVYEADASKP
jgi:predicted amidohydrolase YtcJ